MFFTKAELTEDPESDKANSASTGEPVIGVFSTVQAAERAATRLIAVGFARDRISVVSRAGVELAIAGLDQNDPPSEHAGEAAVAGGTLGAIMGSATLAGAAATVGVVGLALAGPLFFGLALGAVGGGLVGAMVERGIEPDVADQYESDVRRGRILVAVQPKTADERAAAVLALRPTGNLPN